MSTSIYQQVNDICRTLVTTCLTALEKIQLNNDGKGFLICARKATSENIRLVCFIKEYPTDCGVEKDELVQQTLLVRDVVVKLIVQLRSMHQTPGSTLTAGNISSSAQHHVTLLRNELKIAMKKVGMAAHQLSLAEAGLTRPALRSSGHNPMQEDYNPAEVGAGGGPGAGMGGNGMGGGAVMGYLVYEQYAIACLEALSQIPEAVRRRNREEFTTSTRNAINLVNKLISFRRSNANVDNRVELRQNLVSLISHSKMYFVNPDDEVFQQKFIEFKENVENAVKSYLPQGYIHPPPQPHPDELHTEGSENLAGSIQDSSENPDRSRKSALPSLEMVHEDFEGSRGTSDSTGNSRNSSRGGSTWRSAHEITEGTRETSDLLRNSRTRNYHRTATDSDTSKDPETGLNDSLRSPEKLIPTETSENPSVVTESTTALSPREPTSWIPLGEPFLGKTYKSPTLNGREEEEEGKFRLFGTHRRGGDVMFDSRALSEVLDDEDEDDDFDTSVIYDSEILENENSVNEFSQSIIDKVKTTCPNDWEQLDAENKELFEKHIRMVLSAHKRLILAAQSHSIALSSGHNRTIVHSDSTTSLTQIRPKPPKTPRLVPSVPNLLKPSKSKQPRDPRDPDIVRQKENFLKQISEITCSLLGDMYALVVHFNDTSPALEKPGKTPEIRDKTKDGNFRKKILSYCKKLFQFIKESAEIIKDVPKYSTLEKVKQRVTTEIILEKEGTVLPIDISLLARGQYFRYNKQCLLAAIYGHMDSILNMASQFVSTLRVCDVSGVRVNDSSDDQQAFTLLMSCSAFYGLLIKSLDDIATYYYLLQEEEKLKKSTITDKGKKTTNETSIWNEPPEDPSDPTKDLNRPGTLSALIIRLTSSIFSAEHLNAFLSGYELFSSPVQVWEKLEDRYMVPKSALQNEQAQFVKMRCANVMLHWLKKDLHSISVGTLAHIERFASTTLAQDKFTNISSLLLSELYESPGRFEVKLDKPPSRELKVSDDLQQILSMEDKVTIAEQITIIDFQIYEKISYVELTDLKWNESKEKLHIMARNVLNFIRRSNYLALFVATNILLQKKLKDRVKLLIRFVGIAKCLADMHNYNSLMGILVGLGQASIDRLKLTWGKLASKHIDTYRMLQQYFNPGNAFKLLREKLKASGGNALPYMGCILGDLTFMDEGNPNYIMEDNIKLINFPKHLLINRSITELQQFQKTRYNFTLKEPLYTFLHQMPILQDRELFALSLEREPRQTNPT